MLSKLRVHEHQDTKLKLGMHYKLAQGNFLRGGSER